MAIVGLVPAAGYATRLAGSIVGSKEVQLVRGQPVMRYLIGRMWAAGASAVRIATRPDKVDVIELGAALGAEIVTGRPASVSASILLAAHDLLDDDVGLFGFPDTIWTPADGYVPLVRSVVEGEVLALGIFESPYPERSDVAVLNVDGRLLRVDIKPAEPTSALVWAAGTARIGTLRAILRDAEPGDAFSALARTTPIPTVRLGRVIDVGTPVSLLGAADDAIFQPIDEPFTSAGTAGRPATRGPHAGSEPRRAP